MEKLFEKIGDHFNNSEMSDRILVVKVRRDGWEKLEAARRVRSITKTNSHDEDQDLTSDDKAQGDIKKSEQNSYENSHRISNEECSTESCSPSAFLSQLSTDSRTSLFLSSDSGFDETLEAKGTVKRKKKTEPSFLIEGEERTTARNCDSNQYNGDPESNSMPDGSACTPPDVVLTKLLTDICYANKAGAIGLTCQKNSTVTGNQEGSPLKSADDQPSGDEHGIGKSNQDEPDMTETVAREHHLYIHSFWLALNSSYFRSLFFSSGMKETKVKKVGLKTAFNFRCVQ